MLASRARRATDHLGRDESGFTLPELLVAMFVGILVLATAVTVFLGSMEGQNGLNNRNFQVQQARTTMEQIVNELHQGSTVTTATSNQLTLITYVHHATCGGASASTAIQCQVNYTCTAGSCTRMERNTDGSGGGSPVQVATGLSTSNVFTYSPSTGAPTYVGVTLSLTPQTGQGAVTLDDGASLGNVPPS